MLPSYFDLNIDEKLLLPKNPICFWKPNELAC
jgi:hypothetical protein